MFLSASIRKSGEGYFIVYVESDAAVFEMNIIFGGEGEFLQLFREANKEIASLESS